MNIVEATKLMKEKGITCFRKNEPGIVVRYCLSNARIEVYGLPKEDLSIIEYETKYLVNAEFHSNISPSPYWPELDDILADDWEIIE